MQQRQCRYLKSLTGGRWPDHYLVIHCESATGPTNPAGNERETLLAEWQLIEYRLTNGASEEVERCKGISPLSFWEQLTIRLRKGRETNCYMMYAARSLTMLCLWQMLQSGQLRLSGKDHKARKSSCKITHRQAGGMLILSDPPTIVQLSPFKSKGVATMMDLRNWGVESETLSSSATTQVDRVAEWVRDWFAMLFKHNLGRPANTGASQAMRAFRTRFIRHPILIHANTAALNLERSALFSGRNECFRLGKVAGRVVQLDASSHYAAVAAETSLPCRLAGYSPREVDLADLGKRGYQVIAEVTLESESPHYPKRLKNGDLVFPLGSYRTSLCGPELWPALNRGEVKRVHRAAWYESDPIFAKWCQELFALRQAESQAGNPAAAASLKRLTVALFGKFCQHDWNWLDASDELWHIPYDSWYAAFPAWLMPAGGSDKAKQADDGSEPRDKGKYVRWRAIAGRVQAQSPRTEHRSSCPAISAWIYSLGRVRLLKWIATAGWGNVHYCDTDSVWTNEEGESNLRAAGELGPTQLGKLRAKSRHEWLKLYGLKTYATDAGCVAAGCPAGQMDNDYHCLTSWVSDTMEGSLARQQHPQATERLRQHTLTSHYRHGTPQLDGSVAPLRLIMGSEHGDGRIVRTATRTAYRKRANRQAVVQGDLY